MLRPGRRSRRRDAVVSVEHGALEELGARVVDPPSELILKQQHLHVDVEAVRNPLERLVALYEVCVALP